MTPAKSMMVITGEHDSHETFRMIPHHLDCPYNEAIYDTQRKILFVLSKEKKNNLQKLPNSNEEIVIEKYYEYQLTTAAEIINFVKMFATNEKEFSYQQYLN